MINRNEIKMFLDRNYKKITVAKPFLKKLAAKSYTPRNISIVESEFNLRNLFNIHLKYFVNNIEKTYNNYLRKHLGQTTFPIPPRFHTLRELVLHYFKLEHGLLIDFLLGYRSSPIHLAYIQNEFLGKFKYFYNDSIEAGSPIYDAFLKDIEGTIDNNNIEAIVALSLYNKEWLNLSKHIKEKTEQYKGKKKRRAESKGILTSDTSYPIRSSNKQDIRIVTRKAYEGILKIASLDYDFISSSERAQARVLQLKDPRTTEDAKREFFTERPHYTSEMKMSSIEKNRKGANLFVDASVKLQSNPIWYCLARREFLYDIHNPFFDEKILEDKKIKIANPQRYGLIQKLRTDDKYLNELLNEMDLNFVNSLKNHS